MVMHVPRAQDWRRGQQNALRDVVLPAPIKGMDGRLNLASNDPNYCVYAYNLVPSEYGARSREGFREWNIDIETTPGAGEGVRTIIPFRCATDFGVGCRLFAVTNEGIWNVTDYNTTPTLVQAFGDNSIDAGWGSFTHYTLDDGTIRLIYADESNGVFMYDPGTQLWSVPAITGVDPTALCFVVSHKQRLWFVERNSTTGWYLDPGAVEGPATPFYFGSKFKQGGDLVGLYNWTLDSGDGVDDYLVAVSRMGDVIPWRGGDPSAAVSWDIVGTYFIGEVPRGRRIADEYGGDLHVISTAGVVRLSDMLRGADINTQGGELSKKIGRFVRTDMQSYRQNYGWEIRFNPSEGVILIHTPKRLNGVWLQFHLQMGVEAWAFWRGVPALTGGLWDGRYVFGTEDNKVMIMDVTVDNATIVDATGDPIEFSMLSNSVNLGAPARYKWGEYVRPNWIATQPPGYDIKWVYDYTTDELVAVPPSPEVPVNAWDSSDWDEAVWESGALGVSHELRGGWGPGRTLGYAIRGSCSVRTTLISVDGLWKLAGPL